MTATSCTLTYDSRVEVTMLGTASPYPRPGDPCSSFLLSTDSIRLWVDTGSGSLAALTSLCSLADLDAIWISHTHADHFSDLSVTVYALLFGDVSRAPLPVYGPAGWAERLRSFMTHGHRQKIEDAFAIHEISDEDLVEVGPLSLSAHEMNHDALCHGFRAYGDGVVVAYTGDTGVGPGLDRVAADADLLICEAGHGAKAKPSTPFHLTAKQAGAAAARGEVRHLLLTHLAGADVEECVISAKAAGAGNVTGARPGDVVRVTAA